MTTDPTIFYAVPDVDEPVGGVNVMLEHVGILRSAGYRACALVRRRNFDYPYLEGMSLINDDMAIRCDPRLPPLWVHDGLRSVWSRRLRDLRSRARFAVTGAGRRAYPQSRPGARDIVVVPEFWCVRLPALYSAPRLILLVQNQFPLIKASAALRTGPPRFSAAMAVSEACHAVLPKLGIAPVFQVPLTVGADAAEPRPVPKRRQIAYMPRKRRDEAEFVIESLRRSPMLAGYDFVEIDRATRAEVDRILQEALFFVSFSSVEGFGLPPAEAMRAGCIVVGYTGVGGAEYFDDATGIVVPDSDSAGLISAVEAAVTAHARDPARFDRLRAQAKARISERYTAERTRTSLLEAWQTMLEQHEGGAQSFMDQA